MTAEELPWFLILVPDASDLGVERGSGALFPTLLYSVNASLDACSPVKN